MVKLQNLRVERKKKDPKLQHPQPFTLATLRAAATQAAPQAAQAQPAQAAQPAQSQAEATAARRKEAHNHP